MDRRERSRDSFGMESSRDVKALAARSKASACTATIRVAVLFLGCCASMASPLRAQQVFKDIFDGHPANAPLNPETNWSATPITVFVNGGSDKQAVAPISSAATQLFMKPSFYTGGVESPANWPLARSCEQFLRIDFDVLPIALAGSTGRMLLMLDSRPSDSLGRPNQSGYGDAGPLVAVEFDLTAFGHLNANVYLSPDASQQVPALASPIDLGQISSLTSLRIDFGWDYFKYPHDFASPFPNAKSQGEPWFYVRIWKKIGPYYVPQYSRPKHSDGETDGWIECGHEISSGMAGTSDKIGIYKYDWSPLGPGTVYPYWFFDQGTGTSTVTWQIDNVTISQVTPQIAALMVNQLGYDTSGPQWAALRINDPAYRNQSTPFDHIDWKLTGNGIQTQTWTAYAPAGEMTFKEIADLEQYDVNQPGYDGTHFLGNPVQDFWWRWEWSRVSVPATNCIVEADVYKTPTDVTKILSEPFTIAPRLAYSKLIADPTNNITVKNGLQRHAYVTPNITLKEGGWYDANAENGEGRAEALFLSALSNLLRTRRPEMTTAELRDLIGQIVDGGDFLKSLGADENTWVQTHNRIHQTNQPDQEQEGHEFKALLVQPPPPPPPPEEMGGHMWHESHVRQNGYGKDSDDHRNSGSQIWMSCLGLIDAARALTPFGATQAPGYASQASQTRTYMKWLPGHHNPPEAADHLFTYRAQAMLDFLYSEIDPNSGALTAAKDELATDLLARPPTTDHNVQWDWILGDQVDHDYLQAWDPGGSDPGLYCPADAILYCIEHAFPNPTNGALPWIDAARDIVDNWYDSPNHLRPGLVHANPLRITNNWTPKKELEDYYGGAAFKNKWAALEGYAVARFAQVFGRTDSRFDRLVQLATGDLNYLLGINFGIRSHQVLQAPGVAATDLEYGSASMITGVGSHWGAQVVGEYHIWDRFTTMVGPAGKQRNDDWQVAPWDYSRGDSLGSETFIKDDASVIMLIDTLDRVLHPRLVVESESITPNPPMAVVFNNEPNSTTVRLNGGKSVSSIGNGAVLSYPNLQPPEPTVGTLSHYRYRFRLRAANAGSGSCSVSVTVSQGTYNWGDVIVIAPTGDPHEYVVLDAPKGVYSATPLTLASATPFTVTFTVTSGTGPCSFDDFILESEGIPR